ncbi:MAG: MarR family transcriptional regulator [Ruminococcaceae bacterium]|nr:MarR family transcriptional regulator [Oscillospiraceae bacterium]
MHSVINKFLVEAFNEILKSEEISLNKGFRNLSVKEMHVIEVVCEGEKTGENMANILAKKLKVTAGTLTTAVSQLEKKGYLKRERDINDKRIVRITSTESGKEAQEYHRRFHEKMVNAILENLNEEETAVLVKALGHVTDFFRAEYKKEL